MILAKKEKRRKSVMKLGRKNEIEKCEEYGKEGNI